VGAGEKATEAPRLATKSGHSATYVVGGGMNVGWTSSRNTNRHKEKSTALLRFVIVCKGCVAKNPLPKGSGNKRYKDIIRIELSKFVLFLKRISPI